MVARRALVADAGTVKELPAGDTLVDTSLETKRVYYNPGGQWNGSDMASTASIAAAGLRMVVKLPESTTRWRFVARNYDTANFVAQNALTGTGLKIGLHSRSSADGSRSGNFVGAVATTLIGSNFTIPGNGTWYQSSWFTGAGEQFTADVEHLLAVAYTQSPTAAIFNTVGECFRWTTAANALDATVTSGSTATTGTPLDWGIEYEVSTSRKHYFLLGDSIPEGMTGIVGTTSAARRNIPLFRAWPRVWAANNNALVSQLALNGIGLNNYVDASFQALWDRFDWANMGLDGIIIAAGSNDIQGARTLAQMQADTISAIGKVNTATGLTLPVWYQSVLQRWGTGTTAETLRTNYNAWLNELPHAQARGVIDAELRFRTSNAAPYTINPSMTCDLIHPSFKGLEALAACAGEVIG